MDFKAEFRFVWGRKTRFIALSLLSYNCIYTLIGLVHNLREKHLLLMNESPIASMKYIKVRFFLIMDVFYKLRKIKIAPKILPFISLHIYALKMLIYYADRILSNLKTATFMF